MVNNLKPDIIMLAGDIVDEDLAPVIRYNLGEKLKNFKSRFGTFGVTGNHEYIGGVEDAVKYLNEHGINMLVDEARLINNDFYLIGRDDVSMSRFTDAGRKTMAELLHKVDTKKPIIIMDHQPHKLEQVAAHPVDLQLSGHTHNGQLWPFTLGVKVLFPLTYGLQKIKNTMFYVSSGYGTWGPPARIGNIPEIVLLTVEFK